MIFNTTSKFQKIQPFLIDESDKLFVNNKTELCQELISKLMLLKNIGFVSVLKLEGEELFNKVCEYYRFTSKEEILINFEKYLNDIDRKESGTYDKLLIKLAIFDKSQFSIFKSFRSFLALNKLDENFIAIQQFLNERYDELKALLQVDKEFTIGHISKWYNKCNEHKSYENTQSELGKRLESNEYKDITRARCIEIAITMQRVDIKEKESNKNLSLDDVIEILKVVNEECIILRDNMTFIRNFNKLSK